MTADLTKLAPAFHTKLVAAIAEAKAAGVEMVPYVTERSPWDQAREWRKSRSGAEVKAAIDMLKNSGAPFLAKCLEEVGPQPSGPWATNALPGQSFHQWGTACDLYWKKDGKAEWSDMTGYAAFAAICKRMGLNPGYYWSSRDAVHVQLSADNKPNVAWPALDRAMKTLFEGQHA